MRLLLLALGLLLVPVEGRAGRCGLADLRRPTLRQNAAWAHAVFIGEVLDSNPGKGQAEFLVRSILKGDGLLVERQRVKLGGFSIPRYRQKSRILVFCHKDVANNALSIAQVAYLPAAGLEKYARQAITRKPGDLPFYFRYLEDPDREVAEDAHGEFHLVKAAEHLRHAGAYDAGKLRHWLRNPALDSRRCGLYARLLGACGGPEDVPVLRRLMGRTEAHWEAMLGLATAYALLAPGESVPHLRKAAGTPEVSHLRSFAAFHALRLLHEERPLAVTRQIHGEAFALFVTHENLSPAAIDELRRFRRWDLAARVLAVEGHASLGKDANVRRALAAWCLRCPPTPETAACLARLRKAAPGIVLQAEDWMRQEPAVEKPVS